MRALISTVGGLALGILLSQFPEYAQQYTQRLGGAVDELRAITEEFDREAERAGLSRQGALLRYQAVPDDFVAGRGQAMGTLFVRYDQLAATLNEVRNADPLKRLTLMPAFLDTEIGAKTLADFKPAVPVTLEGLGYAGAGLLIGYSALSALLTFVSLPFRRRYPRHQSRI